MSQNVPSPQIGICIPKINSEISMKYIQKVWNQTQMGDILKYTELPWKQDPTNKRILMYIQWNEQHPQSSTLKELLYSGKYITLVHAFPYIWKLYLAKN